MSVFLLGPSIDNVMETTPQAPPPPGRQGIGLASPSWAPGGKLFFKVLPKVNPADTEPLNIYAFYVPQDQAPAVADRTTNYFFGLTGVPTASVHAATADADGNLSLNVPGVQPSLTPYLVQSIIEYAS